MPIRSSYFYIMQQDITPMKRNAVLKIRSLVSWRQSGNFKNPPTLEIILLDEEGSKIQASLKNKSIDQYANILTYGATALISNFSVAANGANKRVKTCLLAPHAFKILFVPSTVVKLIEDFEGPLHGFKFASFSDIHAKRNLRNDDVVDIIGCITKVGDLLPFQKKDGKQSVRVTTHLRDSSSLIIKCTLFGDFAQSLVDLISKEDPARPIILIVQFGKINEYSNEFTVTNSFNGTKIYINEDIDEIKDFLNSYDGDGGVVKIETTATQSMSTFGPDFYKDCEHVLLCDINDYQQGWYVSLATIDSIHFEDGWFYSACKKHNRKVFPLTEDELKVLKNPGNGLKCPGCGHNPQSLFPKFMLNVRVVNDTGSASFTLMDRHVKTLLGVSAYDLRKKYLDDDDVIPEELNDIIGKQHLFKVEVAPYNINEGYYIYTVGALTDDVDTISQFKMTYHIDDGISDNNITLSTDVGSPNFVPSKDVVSATDDNSGFVDLTMSTADSPLGKRKVVDDDPASVKSSSTKPRKRLMLVNNEDEE